MALTDLHVRHAKATGQAYTLGDYDGPSLFVSAEGSKAWHFRYHWLGKQSRLPLGRYPELSLRDARAMRDEARRQIAKGTNPRIARKQKQQATRLAGEYTFMTVYERWLPIERWHWWKGGKAHWRRSAECSRRTSSPFCGGWRSTRSRDRDDYRLSWRLACCC